MEEKTNGISNEPTRIGLGNERDPRTANGSDSGGSRKPISDRTTTNQLTGIPTARFGSGGPDQSAAPEETPKGKKRGPYKKRGSADPKSPPNGTISSDRVNGLTQPLADTIPKPKRRGRIAQLQSELDATRGQLAQYQSALENRDNSQQLVGMILAQLKAITETLLPPALDNTQTKQLEAAWTPVLQESNINIKPIWVALLLTAGLFIPRIIARLAPVMKRRGLFRRKSKIAVNPQNG
jgi:hypothetical protein